MNPVVLLMQVFQKPQKGDASKGVWEIEGGKGQAELSRTKGADARGRREVRIPKGSGGRVEEAGRSTDWMPKNNLELIRVSQKGPKATEQADTGTEIVLSRKWIPEEG